MDVLPHITLPGDTMTEGLYMDEDARDYSYNELKIVFSKKVCLKVFLHGAQELVRLKAAIWNLVLNEQKGVTPFSITSFLAVPRPKSPFLLLSL